MVSFQPPLSPNPRIAIPDHFDNLSKKRKWEFGPQAVNFFEKPWKAEITNSIPDIELRLDTPLPLEWQRCLDIQSGQINFYNTKTNKRTFSDPRTSSEPPSSHGHMSLDLELNLTCKSLRKNNEDDRKIFKHNANESTQSSAYLLTGSSKYTANSGGLMRSPSWLAFEGDNKEMVATVCMRCHLLVMLCKSSPACPNCKFMHPPDQSPPTLFQSHVIKDQSEVLSSPALSKEGIIAPCASKNQSLVLSLG